MIGRWELDTRTGKLLGAVISGFAGRFANIIAPLLAMPAMLAYLGDYDFGLWATAVSITSIAVIADLGIGNGLLTRVANAHGQNDKAVIRHYTSSAYATLAIVAAAFLTFFTLGFLAIGGSEIIYVVVAAYFLGMPAMAFHQFLYGTQRVPFSNLLVSIGAFCAVGGCLAAIALELPAWAVVLAFALPTALSGYVGAAWFYFAQPGYRPAASLVDWTHGWDLLQLGARFFVLSILTQVGLNIDNIIVSTFVGPDAVAAYAIPHRLGTAVLGIVIVALFMPLWGANGDAIAQGDFDWVRRYARRMSLLGVVVILGTGSVLVLYSDLVIEAWVGRTFEDQDLVLGAMILTGAVMAATSPYNMILNAMGRATVQIWPWLGFVVISVVVKISVISPDAVWPLAAVTGTAYGLFVTPFILFVANRGLARAQAERREPSSEE